MDILTLSLICGLGKFAQDQTSGNENKWEVNDNTRVRTQDLTIQGFEHKTLHSDAILNMNKRPMNPKALP